MLKHMGMMRATHGIVPASYFKWHGDDEVVDRLETENMTNLYEAVRLMRKKN